jgi:hypothetical protein
MAQIIKDYRISNSKPLCLKSGDTFKILPKEIPPEWSGWIWAKTEKQEGWISKHYFETRNGRPFVIRDYVAREIDVESGESVRLHYEDCGWSWIEKGDGNAGWIPSENIGELELEDLPAFILEGKSKGWVGSLEGGKKIASARVGSKDVTFDRGAFHYHDSFVGFSDFLGQEHVAYKNTPVWSMSYYGYLLKPDIFSAKDAVKILNRALPRLYLIEKRFLGGQTLNVDGFEYRDINFGDWNRFHGLEKIYLKTELVYEFQYMGGTVRE